MGSTIPLPAPDFVPPSESDSTPTNVINQIEPPSVSFNTVTDYSVLPDIGTFTADQSTVYLGYGITINYDFDSGLRDQPVAAPSRAQLVDFVRIHTGKCRKVVTAVATTVGTKPVLPSYVTNNANDTLLFWQIGSFSPGRMPDGSPVYGVIVRYIFGLQQMPAPTDMLDMGTVPYDTATVASQTLNPADFVNYLIGPAAPISGGASTPITY